MENPLFSYIFPIFARNKPETYLALLGTDYIMQVYNNSKEYLLKSKIRFFINFIFVNELFSVFTLKKINNNLILFRLWDN